MTPSPPASHRRGRLSRASAKPYPLTAIEHAAAILRAIDRFGYLTNDQIELLLFRFGLTSTGRPRSPGGSAYAANTALRRLFDAGYLDRVPVFLPGPTEATVTPHYVNVLARPGVRLAASARQSREDPVPIHRARGPRPWQPILHGYWIRQFAVTAAAACTATGWRWEAWRDDRHLAAAKRRLGLSMATVPDGFFLMGPPPGTLDPTRRAYFLEIDLGTESVVARTPERRDWRGKVESYLAYFATSVREEFGITRLPIVLTVTESESRLAHLLAATAAAGGGGRFWFTTRSALYRSVAPDPDGRAAGLPFWAPIWRVPGQGEWRALTGRWGGPSNAL